MNVWNIELVLELIFVHLFAAVATLSGHMTSYQIQYVTESKVVLRKKRIWRVAEVVIRSAAVRGQLKV